MAKFFWYEMRQSTTSLCSWLACSMHQGNLNVGTLSKGPDFHKIVTAQYAHSMLMRMGNFWLQTVLSLDGISQSADVSIVHRAPCRRDLMFAELVVDLKEKG